MTLSPNLIAETIIEYRSRTPLVHCITNIVVANWTANVLLASGAAPAMVDNAHEAEMFAGVASGVLINTGTPYDDTVAAMKVAVTGALQTNTPWVLDPVAAGGLPWRTKVAAELINQRPAIVRGNASEISGLAGAGGGRGVDTAHSAEAVLDLAQQLAAQKQTVVAVSGPIDYITDGERTIKVANGHELMTKVTGVGCSLGALMAGFAAVTADRLLAATAASALLSVAAEIAVEGNPGPGTFAVRLIDALTIAAAEVADRIKLS